jgi:5-methylcytosine-specific restriction endonuclease McrA
MVDRRRRRRGYRYSLDGTPLPPEMVELRFTRYRRLDRVPYDLYMQVMERDGWKCHYCGVEPSQHDLGVDHVIPQIIGGRTTLSNLVACCRDCNTLKSDKVDATRTFWRPEHYAEMIRVLMRERADFQTALVEMARECRERFGKAWRIPGLDEVLP